METDWNEQKNQFHRLQTQVDRTESFQNSSKQVESQIRDGMSQMTVVVYRWSANVRRSQPLIDRFAHDHRSTVDQSGLFCSSKRIVEQQILVLTRRCKTSGTSCVEKSWISFKQSGPKSSPLTIEQLVHLQFDRPSSWSNSHRNHNACGTWRAFTWKTKSKWKTIVYIHRFRRARVFAIEVEQLEPKKTNFRQVCLRLITKQRQSLAGIQVPRTLAPCSKTLETMYIDHDMCVLKPIAIQTSKIAAKRLHQRLKRDRGTVHFPPICRSAFFVNMLPATV